MISTENANPPPAAPPREPSVSHWRRSYSLLNQMGPIVGLFIIVAFFAILRPGKFLRPDNLQIMLLQTAVVGTAALGATVIIIAGGIDLSVGSNIALCTVIIAKMLMLHVSPLLAALTGIAASMACGLIIGLLVSVVKVSPFIVTLGMWGALRGAAQWFANETDVVPPTTWLNDILWALQPDQRWMIFPPGIWLMFALTAIVGGVLKFTRFGRHVFAIGSNEQTARLCGVHVQRTKLLIYLFATAFAGIAGVLNFSRLTIGDPNSAAGYELNIIAAVVIGGASLNGGEGGVFGTLVGALIMTVVSNGCAKIGLHNSVQQIVTGCIIILAVALDRIRHRR